MSIYECTAFKIDQILLEVKFELLMSSCHPLKQLSNGVGLSRSRHLYAAHGACAQHILQPAEAAP